LQRTNAGVAFIRFGHRVLIKLATLHDTVTARVSRSAAKRDD